MIKLKIISQGKTKESWLEEALEEFTLRLSPFATIQTAWAKSDEQMVEWVKKERVVIALDPRGKEFDSVAFSHYLRKKVEEGGARLTFVIGAADGLPLEIREHYPLLSLSQMTLTHQMTRLFLVEQIYRAFTLMYNLPYHKRLSPN